MVSASITEWIKSRIELWDQQVKSHPNDFDKLTCIAETWITGLKRGQEQGVLAGFNMILDYIQDEQKGS